MSKLGWTRLGDKRRCRDFLCGGSGVKKDCQRGKNPPYGGRVFILRLVNTELSTSFTAKKGRAVDHLIPAKGVEGRRGEGELGIWAVAKVGRLKGVLPGARCRCQMADKGTQGTEERIGCQVGERVGIGAFVGLAG